MPREPDWSRLAAARLQAVTRFPYLARALFALEPRPGRSSMAVDEGWRLYVGPEALNDWSVDECAAVLVHEVTHLIRDHAGRARTAGVGPAQRTRWNLAVDLEVDDDLAEAGLSLPFGGSQPADHGLPPHQLAETYYRRLAAEAPATCGSGAGGEPGDAEPDSPGGGLATVEIVALRRDAAAAVRQAVERGEPVPGGWRRWAQSDGRGIDWRLQLAALVRAGSRGGGGRRDYSYSRPSRRAAAARPVILPALLAVTPSLAVVVDTSASMTGPRLGDALNETLAVTEALGGRGRVTVIACDTTAHPVGPLRSRQPVQLAGGGGTDMGAGLRAAARLRPAPDVVVVLTDGVTPWPDSNPTRGAVVAAILGDGPDGPPWARTVRVPAA